MRSFCVSSSSCQNITEITNWELAPYEHALTALRDRPELIREAQHYRLAQRSHRKGEQQQSILPKEENVVVGVKEKVREHVREHV
jgi:hypothetical protein